jgi:hypothetical protein
MPATPAASSVEWTVNSIVAANTSPFTGEQQVQSWSAQYLSCSITMPPMEYSDGLNWITFVTACDGMANVFALPPWFQAMVPTGLGVSGYWSLSANTQKLSINEGQIVGITFIIREALA